jgi:mono/diheme cytochrome c family protein
MNRHLSAAALAALAVIGTAQAQDVLRSIWSGAYTTEQADRGRNLYLQSCASCHGSALEGSDEIPALTGSHFMVNWDSQPVAELAKRVRVTMPLNAPGTLDNAASADIVAFLLQANLVPAGSAELPAEPALQAQIRFDALNPAGN